MANVFNSVRVRKPKRNVFDLSCVNKLTCEAGELIPIYWEEMLPSDEFKVATANRIRLAPQALPVMHNVDVSMYWFFVPMRILWSNFEEFITGGKDGTSQPTFPIFSGYGATRSAPGTLFDYLGIPSSSGVNANPRFSAMPVAAYIKIYNDYFRDENLQPELIYECSDSFNENSGLKISTQIGGASNPYQRRPWKPFLASWKKDYFTSALPWTQRGNPVRLPLLGNAPIKAKSTGESSGNFLYVDTTGAGTQYDTVAQRLPYKGEQIQVSNGSDYSSLYADLDSVTSATIHDLRRAFRLQEFLERNAVGGSRLTEIIRAHFGVRSPDARLQRAEFVGGSTNPVMFEAVYQNSATQENAPLGDFAGRAMSVGGQKPIKFYSKEHGIFMGIMVIRPRPEYQDITPRRLLHGLNDKFDFFWPDLAHIGEQPILNRELYTSGTSIDDETFGYMPRYNEYRFHPSETHGEMKTVLKQFHMNRIFDSTPKLNQQFMNCNPRTDMFVVQDGNISDHYWCEILIGNRAKRPIPKFGTPMI
nr:MAG: major capsid protein [Microviridae sp.]